MGPLLLTKSTTFLIGPIASLLGLLMNGIFNLLSIITGGHPNIGVAIIVMTFVIYMLMMPLTVQQQKYAKLQNKMAPEINKIQAKYKNKKDQDSMMRMNEETKAVYAKYGVSTTGSCVQLLIQMPILFALYRVIYNVPAYVTKVYHVFDGLVDGLINKIGITDSATIMQDISSYSYFKKQFSNENFASNVNSYAANTFIDVLNRATTADWTSLKENTLIVNNGLASTVETTQKALSSYNNFLGLNIGDSPLFTIQHSSGKIVLIILALLIPVLAAATQWLNVKLMPTSAPANNDPNDQASMMANQMKTMNMMMPLMSAFFCFSLPAGMGLYWIAGSVIRCIQQVAINKHIDKMDFDEIIKKNEAKAKEKARKSTGQDYASQKKVVNYSSMSTKHIDTEAQKAKDEQLEKARQTTAGKKYKEGSLAAKANMVSRYNDSSASKDKKTGK